MFGLNKRIEYGLELISYLAEQGGDNPISLKEVAEAKKLPYKFLEQIATSLREAALIVSKEGRGGGYTLARDPGKISVAEVVEAISGPISLGACSGCPKARTCGQKEVWEEVGDGVRETMEKKTVEDLTNKILKN